ncbi:E2 domain-containing protein [Comamonas sp. SCN 65-56]|mgnify:FL=1|uniref:E2 domain-containing protein n=1 Tax=Comamonas sp. SCN 65-56 TaxID=1660095 RepID=UPI0025C3CEC6|nr:E2 domain-containing protein [Comamonas sp. SCN 65-56]
MSEPAEPLHRLANVAPEFRATLAVNGKHAVANITIALPSGQRHIFALDLTEEGGRVSVREAPVGNLLPAFCPDRHVNSDGSFCLGWGEDDPSTILDPEAARRWWSVLVRFLAHQVSANKRRVWPGRENDRAHGAAARHQAVAEPLAAQFGPTFVDDLHGGLLSTRLDNRRRNPRLELYRAGRLIARVSLHSRRLIRDRFLCPCNGPMALPTTRCGTHAQALANFTSALHSWHEEERTFLDNLVTSGQRCCGTLRECGLAAACARVRSLSSRGSAHERHSRSGTPRHHR